MAGGGTTLCTCNPVSCVSPWLGPSKYCSIAFLVPQDVKKVAGAVGEQSKVLAGNLAGIGDDVAGDVKDNAEPTAAQVPRLLRSLSPAFCSAGGRMVNVDHGQLAFACCCPSAWCCPSTSPRLCFRSCGLACSKPTAVTQNVITIKTNCCDARAGVSQDRGGCSAAGEGNKTGGGRCLQASRGCCPGAIRAPACFPGHWLPCSSCRLCCPVHLSHCFVQMSFHS